MDTVGSSGRSTRGRGVGDWIGRHPGLIPLAVALVFAVLLPYVVVAAAGLNRPVEIGAERVSLLALAWLGAGLVVALIVAIAGASVGRDLGSATRELLGGPTVGTVPGRGDSSRGGAEVVAKLFGLVLYMFVQSVLRQPVVAVGGAFAPKALVDGGYVVLVAFIALALLFSLYISARPPIQHLTWAGLDRLVPTAGYATRSSASTPAARRSVTKGSPPDPATPPAAAVPAFGSARPSAQLNVAEATIHRDLPPALSVEATVVGATPPAAISEPEAEFTVIGVPPTSPAARIAPADVTMIGIPPARIDVPVAGPDRADATIVGVPLPVASVLAQSQHAIECPTEGSDPADATFVGLPPAEPLAVQPSPSVGPDRAEIEQVVSAVGEPEGPAPAPTAAEEASPSHESELTLFVDELPADKSMDPAAPSDVEATFASLDGAVLSSGDPPSADAAPTSLPDEPTAPAAADASNDVLTEASQNEPGAQPTGTPVPPTTDAESRADTEATFIDSEPPSTAPQPLPVAMANAPADRFSFLARRPITPSGARPGDVEATLVDVTRVPDAMPTTAASARPAPAAPEPLVPAPVTPEPLVSTAAPPILPPTATKPSRFGFLGRGASQPARPTHGGQSDVPHPAEDSTIVDAGRTILPDEAGPRSD